MKLENNIYGVILSLLLFSYNIFGQSNPVFPNTQQLIHGTANQPGAVYLIKNVETASNLGILGVDALVTIVSFTGTPIVNNIDVYQNSDNRFEPTITYGSPNDAVRWRIEFIVGGTADASIEDAVLYPLDEYTLEIIDLDAGEWAEVIVPKSYELADENAPGTIVTTSAGLVPNSVRFESDVNETDPGIDPTSQRSIVKVNYENVSIVDITLGRNNNNPNTTRNISLGFLGEVIFGNPYITVVNTPPVLFDQSATTSINTSTDATNLLSGATDKENNIDASTIVILDPNDPTNYGEPGKPLHIIGQGSYTIDGSANIIFTPENEYSGVSMVNFRVRDANLASSNTAVFSVLIGDPPELEITKTAVPEGNISVGDTITYNIFVENTGLVDALNVTIDDLLPDGVTYVDGSAEKTFPSNTNTVLGSYTSQNLGPLNINGRNTVTVSDDTTGSIPSNATLIDYSFSVQGEAVNGSKISEIDMEATYPNGTVYDLDFGDDLNLPDDSGDYNVNLGPKSLIGTASGVYQFKWSEDRNNRRTDNRISNLTYTINYQYIPFPVNEQTTNAANPPRNMVTSEDNITLKPGESMTVTFKVIVNQGTVGSISNTATVNAIGLPNPISDTAENIIFDPNIIGTAMITQIFENGSEKWIEITNVHDRNSIPENTIHVQLYTNKTGDQTGISPDATYTLTSVLNPGQSLLIGSTTNTISNTNSNSIEVINNEITSFNGINSIITLSLTNDQSSWINRYDIFTDFESNTSSVRIDETLVPNSNFNATEWVTFVNDNLNPYRILEFGGSERHPHDSLLSEIVNANSETNTQLGLHRVDITERIDSNWSNGLPDRSRHVVISENYNHTDNFNARKLKIRNNSKFSITNNLLVVSNEVTITNTADEIRLIGNSQLIQTHTNSSQVFGDGLLLVEQNSIVPSLYRYNYMGSPVNSANKTTYSIEDVLKDGTTPLDNISDIGVSIAKDISFIGGYDGSYDLNGILPISIAEYWIYTYSSGNGNRSNWTQKFKNGEIPQTDGFIFKGPGREQNYTFVGTPKDGNIPTPNHIGPYESYLVGNPYASAINVNKFIEDNINSISGTLYFWEHHESANGEEDQSGHNFSGYIGGYATRNRAMGLAANSPFNDSNNNNGTAGIGEGEYSEPKAYIAIGQGFFISGNESGGPIVFNNSQREYIIEGDDSAFFKQGTKISKIEKTLAENSLPIIKIGFDYKNNQNLPIHRQIGISFHESNSFEYDTGFDSTLYDLGETDLYWDFNLNDHKYIIAGVQAISDDLQIPLTIKVAKKQDITLTIDEWQHIDRDVFIYDTHTGIQHKINDTKTKIHLEEGTHKDRFFLSFEVLDIAGIDNKNSFENIKILYNNHEKTILLTGLNKLEMHNTQLINLGGIILYNKEHSGENKNQILIDVNSLNKGVYILRAQTNYGTMSKKIIIH